MVNLPLANITQRKARSIISALSVALGIMILLVLVGLTQGTLQEVATRQVYGVDADLILYEKDWNLIWDRGTPLDVGYKELLGKIDGVASVIPVILDRFTLPNGRGYNVYGIDPADFPYFFKGRKFISGRLFEDSPALREVIVDERFSKEHHLTTGGTFKAKGKDFTIAGVAQYGIPAQIMLGRTTMEKNVTFDTDRVSFFYVRTAPGADAEVAAERIKKAYSGLRTLKLADYMEELEKNFALITSFVSAVVFLCLVVSFLTILLVMYTTVIERTRDIGVLKALGASKGFIIREILVESVLLCLAGVAIGIGLSFLAKLVISWKFPHLTMDIGLGWIVVAVVVAVIGGTLGALYPAIKASRQEPLESLNYF